MTQSILKSIEQVAEVAAKRVLEVRAEGDPQISLSEINETLKTLANTYQILNKNKPAEEPPDSEDSLADIMAKEQPDGDTAPKPNGVRDYQRRRRFTGPDYASTNPE